MHIGLRFTIRIFDHLQLRAHVAFLFLRQRQLRICFAHAFGHVIIFRSLFRQLRFTAFQFSILLLHFAAQTAQFALQLFHTEKRRPNVLGKSAENADRHRGNHDAGEHRNQNRRVFRSHAEERNSFFTDLTADFIAQKSDQTAHDGQHAKD